MPTGTATSLEQIHCRVASASRPTTRYFENDVWSNTATPVRVARCSAADQGSQSGFPHVYGVRGDVPAGAKTLARSHPARDPKAALRAASRSCSGEQRNGRALSSSRFGHGTA